MLLGMITLKQKIAAEVRMRELIAKEGMPEPDEVEYGQACIRLIWHEQKFAAVIDLEDPKAEKLMDPSKWDEAA